MSNRRFSPFYTLDQVPGQSRQTSRMGPGHISMERESIQMEIFVAEETWMAKMSAMATKDFCPPLSWFISLISLFFPVKLTAQDTPVAFSSLCAWSSSWGKHQIYCRFYQVFINVTRYLYLFRDTHNFLYRQIYSFGFKTNICLFHQNSVCFHQIFHLHRHCCHPSWWRECPCQEGKASQILLGSTLTPGIRAFKAPLSSYS